jgi:hypothetical protein
MPERAKSGFPEVTMTRRQRERLAAIGQYLYDYVISPVKHGEDTMPLQAWEVVEEIERLLDRADQHLAIVNRTCVGGDRVLVEVPPKRRRPAYRLEAGRLLVTWLPGRCRLGARRRQLGGFDAGLGVGVLIGMRRAENVSRWRVQRRPR